MKNFKRTETRYILKHVSGKYFKNSASWVDSERILDRYVK